MAHAHLGRSWRTTQKITALPELRFLGRDGSCSACVLGAISWTMPLKGNNHIRGDDHVISPLFGWTEPASYARRARNAANPARAARRHRRGGADLSTACVLERRTGKAGNPRLRARNDQQGESALRAAGRPHRRIRPGRHALGRASAIHAARLLPRPCRRAGEGEAGVEGPRAVQDRSFRRPRGHREAFDEGFRRRAG
jgi:hypothetical protein